MFASFKMDLSDFCENDDSLTYSLDRELFEARKRKFRDSLTECLDTYLTSDGALDATKIEEAWFPKVKADVFLSHSHKDEKAAIAFAIYLEGLGIRAFIDSCVWGYAVDLLRRIDNEYCMEDNGYAYDYGKRNISTSHVHMILNGALLKMMDQTECFIFLDTPNALKTEDIWNGKTDSCWIYSELLMSGCLRREKPIRKRSPVALDEAGGSRSLSGEYTVSTSHLIPLSLDDIKDAYQKSKAQCRYRGIDVLDQMYLKNGLFKNKEC